MNKKINNINIIGGDNFSGRSEHLQNLISKTMGKGLYIGELPNNYLSGIAPTVSDEIQLHRNNQNIYTNSLIELLLNQIDFKQHNVKNPFTLSGGEQALLAIITHILLNPDNLAVDSIMEQLSKEWVLKVLDVFYKLTDSNIIISDNRFSSYGLTPTKILHNSNNVYKLNHEHLQTEDSSEECIQLENIDFAYKRGKKILSGLNWKLESGAIYHLKGLNGAGKSTLAKILSGVLKPQKGNIFVNGQKFNSYHFPGKLCGYSFQNPDEQLFSRTVMNELNGKLCPDKARMLARTFGLETVLDKHPQELPFVLRKRLSLAATLSISRNWYIFDEPTLGQDDKTVNQLANIFIKLVQNGRSVIVISHFSDFMIQFNTKKVILVAGKIT